MRGLAVSGRQARSVDWLLCAALAIAFATDSIAQEMTLEAPASAPVGSQIEVRWAGASANSADFLSLVPVDAPEGTYRNWAYANTNPVVLEMPQEPGAYELRYLDAVSPYPTRGRSPITAVCPSFEPRTTHAADSGADSDLAPVGALTQWVNCRFAGSFCTGTLIRTDWVLTAAHCLEDATPSRTLFFVGSDATDPASGAFYEVLAFTVHPGYNHRTLANDIALIRLQSPVDGVTPIPFNVEDLSPYQGRQLQQVGFGAIEGVQESGGGVKRTHLLSLTKLGDNWFDSAYNGASTCFGDSGGPTLMTIGGTWSIVGVISAGAACDEPGCDPCKVASTSVRVDVYRDWIEATLK